MQVRYSYEENVCLSVRPSVKRVNCDKTKETFAHILYYMKYRSWRERPILPESLNFG